MPVLANNKHEAFAQLLAKGWKQFEAYEEVGYSGGNRSASTRLAQRTDVAERVKELQAANTATGLLISGSGDTSLASLGLTTVWVAEAYQAIHAKALEARRFKEANDAIAAISKLIAAEQSDFHAASDKPVGPAISVQDTLMLLKGMKEAIQVSHQET